MIKIIELIIFCILIFVIMFTLPQWLKLQAWKLDEGMKINKEIFDANFWTTVICLVIEFVIIFNFLK